MTIMTTGTLLRRIGLIHAVPIAMPPVEAAFRELWPEAIRMNLLDDALPSDLERAGGLNGQIDGRIRRLAEYSIDAGADAVLFTCSAFGAAIEKAATGARVPVLKPNEAMFERVFRHGKKIGMLATFQPSVASMETEFYAAARKKGVDATIETLTLPAARKAANAGDYALHNRLLVEAAAHFRDFDALMLAHFSMAPALAEIQAALPIPVLAAPQSAVAQLKTILTAR